jgi:catechol 2,3-dioxygenase-like lactoylglutathione lyase family enzyme
MKPRFHGASAYRNRSFMSQLHERPRGLFLLARTSVRRTGSSKLAARTERGPEVSWSSKSVDVITLFVEDLERAKSFYQDVFGLSAVYEDENAAVFRFQNLGINLLKIDAAYGLIEPGTVASREAGSRFQFTIGVENVDQLCEELAKHGVHLLNGPMNRPWGIRTASFTDPAGHIWEIAQDLPRPEGS